MPMKQDPHSGPGKGDRCDAALQRCPAGISAEPYGDAGGPGPPGGLAIQNASMYLKLQEDKKSLEEDIWSHRSWL